MIEQRARFARVRDRSVFVGNPDDVVAGRLRARACRRSATGRATTSTSPATSPGFDPADVADRAALRRAARLPAATSGSASSPSAARASGAPLLRRVLDAVPLARRAGRPSCASSWSPARASTRRRCRAGGASTVRGYVPDLYRHLAACRPRRRAGRPHHDHGADREPAAVRLRAAAPPLRAELPRAAPARAVRRRAGAWTTTRPPTRTSWPTRSSRRSAARSPTGRSRPTARPVAAGCSPTCSEGGRQPAAAATLPSAFSFFSVTLLAAVKPRAIPR